MGNEKKNLEQEAESFLVACMQACEDEAPPPLELPVEVVEMPEYISVMPKNGCLSENMCGLKNLETFLRFTYLLMVKYNLTWQRSSEINC